MLSKAGLDPKEFAQPHLMLDDSRPGFNPGTHDVCLMRGGVVYSDKVTTVSPTYACEVYRPEFGFGMQVRINCAVLGSMARCPPVVYSQACTNTCCMQLGMVLIGNTDSMAMVSCKRSTPVVQSQQPATRLNPT